MRRCIVNSLYYTCINPDAPPNVKKEYENRVVSSVEAWFHQFISETDDDGVSCAMAIVEYDDGNCVTVPLNWIVMKPYVMPEMAVLEASPIQGMFSEDLERHIKEVFNIGQHQFTMLCQNLASMRR